MKLHLNNKGYMLVEIILAAVIAMGIAYFITNLTIKAKNRNDDLLVKTLASTDQAIIYNTIMKDLSNEDNTFECSDIKITDNIFEYKGSNNIISDYVDVQYDPGDDCSYTDDGKIIINIGLDVPQLEDDFDVKIEYMKEKVEEEPEVVDEWVDGLSDCFEVVANSYSASSYMVTMKVCWRETYNKMKNASKVEIYDIEGKINNNNYDVYFLGGEELQGSTDRGFYINGKKLVAMSYSTGGYKFIFPEKNKYNNITINGDYSKKLPWTSGEIQHKDDGTLTVPIRIYLSAIEQDKQTLIINSSHYSKFDRTVEITLTELK